MSGSGAHKPTQRPSYDSEPTKTGIPADSSPSGSSNLTHPGDSSPFLADLATIPPSRRTLATTQSPPSPRNQEETGLDPITSIWTAPTNIGLQRTKAGVIGWRRGVPSTR